MLGNKIKTTLTVKHTVELGPVYIRTADVMKYHKIRSLLYTMQKYINSTFP